MISPVMKHVYAYISNYFLKNGGININNQIQTTNEKQNLISQQTLFYYYEKFCESIMYISNSSPFIIMQLPEKFKGFTFRFLKIVLNSQGIKLSKKDKYNDILLKAYLAFVIIHEQNQFIWSFLNINIQINLCKTLKIVENNKKGKFLIKLLFGHELLRKFLNLEQAKYILDVKNWYKKTFNEFREGFEAINPEENNGESIIYLNSESISLCDHSKLD